MVVRKRDRETEKKSRRKVVNIIRTRDLTKMMGAMSNVIESQKTAYAFSFFSQ